MLLTRKLAKIPWPHTGGKGLDPLAILLLGYLEEGHARDHWDLSRNIHNLWIIGAGCWSRLKRVAVRPKVHMLVALPLAARRMPRNVPGSEKTRAGDSARIQRLVEALE